jgi:large subunit ribosomal protein L18
MGSIDRTKVRNKRKKRVKQKTRGTSERPRLTIFRSAGNIYAQLIDDLTARTLLDASTLSNEVKSQIKGNRGNIKSATIVGEFIAKKALEKGFKKVVFDRNGFLYHGRVKAFAESAREHGLEF